MQYQRRKSNMALPRGLECFRRERATLVNNRKLETSGRCPYLLYISTSTNNRKHPDSLTILGRF